MVISTKTVLVYMVDGFKIEGEERDWGQVVMRSLWKGFAAKRNKEMGQCLSDQV